MWNKYEVEAWLAGAVQASRMHIVNSGNSSLKAPSEQRNLLSIQPEELQYPSPDSLDDFLQAMNLLNKIYYFPVRLLFMYLSAFLKRGSRRTVLSVPLILKLAVLRRFSFCVFLMTSKTEVKSGHQHLHYFQFSFLGSRYWRISGGSSSPGML